MTIDRRHPLPANPNCVSFAAEAHEVLVGRTWAEVLRLGLRIATPFHEASGLAVLVGFGWRVALDRKNRRHSQVTVYFVFDGPATAGHLDALDAAVEGEVIRFGAGSIERIPANGIRSVLLSGGQPHLILSEGEGSTPWLRRLELVQGKINPVQVALQDAGSDDVPPELVPTVGLPAPYGDQERETERMRLAFARHFSTKIVEADGVVRDGEAEFMTSVFPAELLERLGLTHDAVQQEYLEAARDSLGGILGHHDKLGLIGLFFSACYSDGSLDAKEMRILKEAGDWLGLTREEVVKYLRRFW